MPRRDLPVGRDARFVTGPAGDGHLETIEYFVPHVSTLPATAGEGVMLFVRERVRVHGRRERPAVLMVTGATTSAIPVFDLEFQRYSWMTQLAKAGFDVFVMDLTGYGFSPRPFMDDPCNASTAQQQAFLIPNPLSETCPPNFERLLTTPDSDRGEIDTVVNFIRELRGLDRVHLVGWSRGGARVGSYAAIHPEKVNRLVLFAPNYGRSAPDGPPADLPLSGFPLDVQGSAAFWGFWDADVNCEDQFDPQIRDHIRDSMLAFDPLGAEWGDAGVRRAPGLHGRATEFWGWNRSSRAALYLAQIERAAESTPLAALGRRAPESRALSQRRNHRVTNGRPIRQRDELSPVSSSGAIARNDRA